MIGRRHADGTPRKSVSQCYTRPSMDDGAHALAEHRALHTRHCVRSQGKGITTDKSIVRGAAVGTPTHGPASACSEMSIAALVLAAHARTGLVRAMRGEGGLALAGMARKASGGRLFSSVWRQAERSAASSGHLERSMWNLSSAVRMLRPNVMLGHPIGRP